jgi:glycosyltransferase involved in cell wall biosynthesis/ubiquinone/menaquinone biosynthesis C-methylase UbiE
MNQYLYLEPPIDKFYFCEFSDLRLLDCQERHKIELSLPTLQEFKSWSQLIENHPNIQGIVIGLNRGWLGWTYLNLVDVWLKRDKLIYLYWKHEKAIEKLDRERLISYFNHFYFINILNFIKLASKLLKIFSRSSLREYYYLTRSIYQKEPYTYLGFDFDTEEIKKSIEKTIRKSHSVDRVDLTRNLLFNFKINGCGVYLRTDFWACIQSGGSYGHTCYVAKELDAITTDFFCFMPQHYSLLGDLDINQIVLDSPSQEGNEQAILKATKYYYERLKPTFEALKPAYIYERLCLGNYAGVLLSQKFSIPYIVEYNGSEISMKRSFDKTPYRYEQLYLKAEEAAFRQASVISVVSEIVKNDLVQRGIKSEKILVNPNGADVDNYAPLLSEPKQALRQNFGFTDSHCVVGFIGTFGGWHGIDVLAEAMPKICQKLPEIHFLLIGDGNYKYLIDEAVSRNQLEDRVIRVGRVSQQEGAKLLGACDLYVAPHSSHMVDSRFFGSPTKIFEYMAMEGGIVASDLEQIGEVLSPALRWTDLVNPNLVLTDERAVLCTPGDVEEFVNAVVELAKRPDIVQILGKNARRAVIDHFSWEQHVAHLWSFYQNHLRAKSEKTQSQVLENSLQPISLETDIYKNQIQQQWDNDPCGSHYVKQAKKHTLEWFIEAEKYRYKKYAPWMPKVMEFDQHSGEKVLEIGGGMGTDLCQFAIHGARVTDLDLSSGHLALAQENFRLRGLEGKFVHHDAENLPFADNSFDLVYSNGVIHHTPNTSQVVQEIYRVLKPGGKVMVMVYAENSLHYWRNLVTNIGLDRGELYYSSMGEIMSRHVEISENNSKPLVKVYTKTRIKKMFSAFNDVKVLKRQLIADELPRLFRWLPLEATSKLVGWNLIVKATKPE